MAKTPATLRVVDTADWTETARPASSARRGPGAPTPAVDSFVELLTRTGKVEAQDAVSAEPSAERRAVTPGQIRFEAATGVPAAHVLMVRHPSDAITFHLPVESERRGASRTLRFVVPIPSQLPPEELPGGERRGIPSRILKAVLLKVGEAVAPSLIPKLAGLAESLWWKQMKLAEGWKAVTPASLTKSPLAPADLSKVSTDKPNLLFLHGTFSHTASAFSDLASNPASDGRLFFDFARTTYGDRIFGFDHFTVSKDPIANARELLAALPAGPSAFDVITHSRGGLVLRCLTELRSQVGPESSRFVLRRAALVASPNEGTPLASHERLQLLLTWMANIIDFVEKVPGFGQNPIAMGVDFITEGLSWIANHVIPNLPGLESMDINGDVIRALQAPPGPGSGEYSALVANFQPDARLIQRMVDAGVDAFFASANDLVVPSEGGWRVDPSSAPVIPGSRIGCFGQGGNIAGLGNAPVMHTSFFRQPATADFLVKTLSSAALGLTPMNPAANLPYGFRRGFTVAPAPAPLPPAPAPALPEPRPEVAIVPAGRDRTTGETLYLTLLDPDEKHGTATLVATFRNATVTRRVRLRGRAEGRSYHDIIQLNRSIRRYVGGEDDKAEPPHGDDLIKVGREIFNVLLPGPIRRLYDIARAEQPSGRVNLIFTSELGWVADLPYEFLYDPVRESFLATSELNFTRNVVTAVPADGCPLREPPLRILVVVAQPLGLAHLSVDQESNAIRSGFSALIDAKLATVDVLLEATPARLHQLLQISRPFDIVHFIGHGEYDAKTDTASLIFQDENGRMQRVEASVAQQLFCRREIRLIFLNACDTAKGGRADFNRGLAQRLVQGGVPAVVANQYSVLDVTATSFAQHFYWSLAHGASVGDAAREARIAVNYSIPGENIDWAVPVIFARDPAGCLVQRPPVADFAARLSKSARREVRRAVRRPQKWGLWDVQGIIPNLPEIAQTLTDCQQEVAFEAVHFSAPLGTWRRSKDADNSTCLDAEKIGERMRGKARELGVYRLMAITNLPLRYKKIKQVYAVDPNDEITIISLAGYLDQLNPPTLSLERLIGNAVAYSFAQTGTHEKGATEGRAKGSMDCPGYFNDEKNINYAAGHLQLCPLCRARLRKARKPGRIAVAEALLNAFPG